MISRTSDIIIKSLSGSYIIKSLEWIHLACDGVQWGSCEYFTENYSSMSEAKYLSDY
jgi:hypothetical protein